jgi:hypothetical protein
MYDTTNDTTSTDFDFSIFDNSCEDIIENDYCEAEELEDLSDINDLDDSN